MSDFNSSLPVRTENAGDVIAKIADATIPSQQLAVDAAGKITAKLDDAAGNGITSQTNGGQQALDVGINVAGVQIDPRQIRPLTSADVVTVDQGTSPWVENLTQVGGSAITLGQKVMASSLPVTFASDQSALPVSQSGSWTVTSNQGTSPWITKDVADGSTSGGTAGTFSQLAGGIYNSTPPTLTNGQQASLQFDSTGRLLTDANLTYDTNYGTVGANTLRSAAQVGNTTGAADFNNGATGAQTLRVAANLAVAGANVSNTNPVPVTITGPILGTSVNDYKDASAIAAGSSDNHDYTVTAGKTLTLNQLESSASGKAKMEVQVETGVATGTFNSRFVQFNSTSTSNMSIRLVDPISVAAGVRVRLIMSNLDKAAQDLYSTICGQEN